VSKGRSGQRLRYKAEIKKLVEEMLKPANSGRCLPESALTVEWFIEDHYLPYADREKRPSTSKGYRDNWKFHLSSRIFCRRTIRVGGVGERLKPAVLKNKIADSLSGRKFN
jgi:hypothetical protein